MRIALDGRFIQDHFPGIGRYTYHLARALPEVAPEDHLIVFVDPEARNTRYDLGSLARPNVELVDVWASAFSPCQQFTLPRLARRLGVQVYHSPYLMMPFAMPCPTVLTVHDIIPRVYPSAMPNQAAAALFGPLIHLALWRASAIVTDSRATAHDLRHYYHVHKEITAIHLAADDDFGPSVAPPQPEWLQRFGIQRPYVLYVGINKPHKNLPRLVQAWARLPDELLETHQLVLAGWEDTRYREARDAVAGLGLIDDVCFLGAVATDDLPALYRGAVGFVFPSLYEGFGLPILEAMASGTPVLCSDVSSLPEIAGDAALFFAPGDTGAINHALRGLLLDASLRQSLRAKGLARAQTFTWRRTAEDTLRVYRRVVAGARR